MKTTTEKQLEELTKGWWEHKTRLMCISLIMGLSKKKLDAALFALKKLKETRIEW